MKKKTFKEKMNEVKTKVKKKTDNIDWDIVSAFAPAAVLGVILAGSMVWVKKFTKDWTNGKWANEYEPMTVFDASGKPIELVKWFCDQKDKSDENACFYYKSSIPWLNK